MISAISFTISIVAYGISQLQQHKKLSWMYDDKPFSFWGKLSHRRKYRMYNSASGERFKFSTTFLVSLTDGYHFCQMIMFLSLSFGISQLIDIYGVWDFPLTWILILLIHWLTRRILSK